MAWGPSFGTAALELASGTTLGRRHTEQPQQGPSQSQLLAASSLVRDRVGPV